MKKVELGDSILTKNNSSFYFVSSFVNDVPKVLVERDFLKHPQTLVFDKEQQNVDTILPVGEAGGTFVIRSTFDELPIVESGLTTCVLLPQEDGSYTLQKVKREALAGKIKSSPAVAYTSLPPSSTIPGVEATKRRKLNAPIDVFNKPTPVLHVAPLSSPSSDSSSSSQSTSDDDNY